MDDIGEKADSDHGEETNPLTAEETSATEENKPSEKPAESPREKTTHFVQPAEDSSPAAKQTESPSSPAKEEQPVKKAPGNSDVPEVVVPKHFDVDADIVWEMMERRKVEVLFKKLHGPDAILQNLKTSMNQGIDSSTIPLRIEQYGKNQLAAREPVTFLEMLWEACQDRVIQILAVAAVVSIILGVTTANPHSGKMEPETGWIEGFAIVISITVVVMTGAVNNYQKAKQFEEMEKGQNVKPITVTRDGQQSTIMSDELVVGDIVRVENGNELMCDLMVLHQQELKTNESSITGEPDLVHKCNAGEALQPGNEKREPFLISGTNCEEGNGTAVVIAVGMKSFQGRMKEALNEEGSDTPLQQKLTALGDRIGIIGSVGAVLLLVALIIKDGIEISQGKHAFYANKWLNFLIVSITIIAVAIPEGLPLAVTISLAFSMKAMMKENCLVRILSSCETMGAATAVCSDKTGTLTTNKMTAVQAVICDEEFIIKGYGLSKRHDGVLAAERNSITLPLAPELIDEFTFGLAVNSTAHEVNEEGAMKWTGNKTEIGILGIIACLGRNYDEQRKSVGYPENVRQFPFSSKKKRMTTQVNANGTIMSYMKGASEKILADCFFYKDKTGAVNPMTDEKRAEINSIILDMATQGNRTIGVALQKTDLQEYSEEEPELQYVWVGVLGIQDPIREEVPDAVEKCHAASLIVRMVTGDNINTAKAIAQKANIFHPEKDDYAMTGEEFREMAKTNKEELLKLLPRLRVLARSSPNDKYVLVGLLQNEVGEVVGVTGDGTNDAPALKLADVGFAMNTGTDIAKGAADMVLIDDNFATVVTAIKWGRAVNDNIKKFLQYQLAINFAGVGLTVVGSLASSHSKEPIAPVQLLWLNLIMDTLAALSLSTERPEELCLTRLPVFKKTPLLTNHVTAFIAVHGLYQFTLILLILFLGHKWFKSVDHRSECANFFSLPNTTQVRCTNYCKWEGGVMDGEYCQQGAVHSTMIFNTFIWFQIFNVVNARKIYPTKDIYYNCFEGLWDRSRIMIMVFGIIITLQIIAVEVFGPFMSTTNLTAEEWGICVGLGATELVVGLILRIVPITDFVPTKEEELEALAEERKKVAEEEEERRQREKEAREKLKAGETVEDAGSTKDPSLKKVKSMSVLKSHRSSAGTAGL